MSKSNCSATISGGNATVTFVGTSNSNCTQNVVTINGGNGNSVTYAGHSNGNTTNIQGGSSNNVVVYQYGNANNNTTNIGQAGAGAPSNGNTAVHTTSALKGAPTGNTTNINNGSNNRSLRTKGNTAIIASNAGTGNSIN